MNQTHVNVSLVIQEVDVKHVSLETYFYLFISSFTLTACRVLKEVPSNLLSVVEVVNF